MPPSPPVLLPSKQTASLTQSRRPVTVPSIHTASANLPSHSPPMDSATIDTAPIDLLLAASQLLLAQSHLRTAQCDGSTVFPGHPTDTSSMQPGIAPSQTVPIPATQDSTYQSGWSTQSTCIESATTNEITTHSGTLRLVQSESQEEGVPVDTVASNGAMENQSDLTLRPLRLRQRKMPREGPEARLAPHEESAVSRVLRTAVHRPGQPIFFPYIGTTFNSCEEAWEYYNLYSWEIGFGIRYGHRSTNRKDYQTIQDLVCSCEGLDKNLNSSSQRTNCKAMIRLLRTSDHGWYISKVVDQHNHEFSVGYAEKITMEVSRIYRPQQLEISSRNCEITM